MSIESFYINIIIDNFNDKELDIVLKENSIFKSALSYNWDPIYKELSIKATLVCFLLNCDLIYKICELISVKSTILEIETRNVKHVFDFKDFIEFFTWIYSCWKERLEDFNKNWGAFVVHPKNYYRSRRKLRKKYMLKY